MNITYPRPRNVVVNLDETAVEEKVTFLRPASRDLWLCEVWKRRFGAKTVTLKNHVKGYPFDVGFVELTYE